MQGILYDDAKFKKMQSSGNSGTHWYNWNILVQTGTNMIHEHTSFESRSIMIHFPTPTVTSLHCTLDLFLSRSVVLQGNLLNCQTTKVWLAAPK
jgi:hypothetical protein